MRPVAYAIGFREADGHSADAALVEGPANAIFFGKRSRREWHGRPNDFARVAA
jgi:hypothetical protein